MNEKFVLIVDDEPDIQEILGTYLKRLEEVSVVGSLSGEEALATYRQLADDGTPPVMVVIDLNLSGSNSDEDIIDAHRSGESTNMDGVRTAEAILALDEDAVVWGYTAWADTSWGDRLREVGADRVVDRIVPFKEFAAMVSSRLLDI